MLANVKPISKKGQKDNPGKWWTHHPWRYFKNCGCGTWGQFSGGLDIAGLTVGFNDLKGPIQPQGLYDSKILRNRKGLLCLFH